MDSIAHTTYFVAATCLKAWLTTHFLRVRHRRHTVLFLTYFVYHEIITAGSYVLFGSHESSINMIVNFWKGYAEADKRYAGRNDEMFTRHCLSLLVLVPVAISIISRIRCGYHNPVHLVALASAIFVIELVQFVPDLIKKFPNLHSDHIVWPQVVLYHLSFLALPFHIVASASAEGQSPSPQQGLSSPQQSFSCIPKCARGKMVPPEPSASPCCRTHGRSRSRPKSGCRSNSRSPSRSQSRNARLSYWGSHCQE